MLLGFEHVNLVASNMDRTLAFYVGLLGLTLRVRRRTDSGGEIHAPRSIRRKQVGDFSCRKGQCQSGYEKADGHCRL